MIMNTYTSTFLKISLSIFFFAISPTFVYAAKILSETGNDLLHKEIRLTFFIDPEGEILNAYEGQISFDKDKLTLDHIETDNSIVTAWITRPEKNNSTLGDDSILFEGITQGGFSGVSETGTVKESSGKLFSLVFSVKKEGTTIVSLAGLKIYKGDGDATEVPLQDKDFILTLPATYLKSSYFVPDYTALLRKENEGSDDIYAEISKSEDIYGGQDFLAFENTNRQKSVESFEISESPSKDPKSIPAFSWTEAKSPYLLTKFGLTNYVHIRVNYSDGSYSYKTLQTVEKSDETNSLSYILIIAALFMLTSSYVIFIRKKED